MQTNLTNEIMVVLGGAGAKHLEQLENLYFLEDFPYFSFQFPILSCYLIDQ